MKKWQLKTLAAQIALAGFGFISITPAFAQSSDTEPSAEASDRLETVVVTATRREESVQKVPVAVTVVSGKELAEESRTVNAIAAKAPALNFKGERSSKDSTLILRGIGTISTSPGVEPSVSTVVDGVVLGSRGQAVLDLVDLERVEVLRGPQGTLFGRNASAGVLNITTQAPTEETTGYLETAFYQGGEIRTKARISGALVPEVLRGSLTLLDANYAGNVTNHLSTANDPAPGHNSGTTNGYSHQGARSKLEWTPNDQLTATLGIDYLHSNDAVPLVITSNTTNAYTGPTTPPAAGVYSAAFAAALSPVIASAKNRSISEDYKTYFIDDTGGVNLNLDYKTDSGYTLTSITAWRDWHNTQFQNGDQLSQISATYPGSVDRGDLHYQQYSQELRIASPQTGWFDYVAGLYYFHGADNENYQRWVTRASGIADTGRATYGTRNSSYAVFGEGRIHFSDSLRLIAGLRETHDELSYFHSRISTNNTGVTGTAAVAPGIQQSVPYHKGSTSANGLTARVGPQWDITEDVTTYATYSRGYKGPAYNVYFNQQQPPYQALNDTNPLDPETSNAYEVGIKSLSFDRRLQANLAVFYAKYNNFQANATRLVAGAPTTNLINAGTILTRGVELDLQAQLTQKLRLSSAVAYTHARIDEIQHTSNANDYTGKPLPYAPDWKANVRANYTTPVTASWKLNFATDYNWQSKTIFDITQQPNSYSPAYGIWNASIAFDNAQKGFHVALIGKNLANKSYANFVTAGGGYVGRIVPRDDRRYFGIDLRKDF